MTLLVSDTSALINLCEVYVGHTHITTVLNRLFEGYVSTEIPVEVRRNRQDCTSHYREVIRYVRQSRRRFHRQEEYEQLLTQRFLAAANPLRHRGERYNCALAVYEMRKQKGKHVILLTDDDNARNGLIKQFDERFKITTVWSSFDLIQHVYFAVHPEWPLAQAGQMLRLVNAQIPAKNAQQRLVYINQRMREVDALLRAMPTVRGRRRYGF